MEARVAPGMPGQKVQKVPLRHQSNEFTASAEMGEVSERNELVSDLSTDFAYFLMWLFEKILEDAEFMH